MSGRGSGFWDGFAASYSAFQQGDGPRRIVDRLFQLEILKPSDSVLEVAAGTGAYSIELAPRVRILTCMDSSERMLDKLFESVRAHGFTNVERFHKDWEEYIPRKGYCACLATLCPGSDRPESIRRMEGAARETCAIVSWVVNHHDDLEMAVWDALGLERPHVGRGSTSADEWLMENGRSPHVETFEVHVEAVMPAERKASEIEGIFRASGVNADVRGTVMDIIGDEIYRYSANNCLKMVCWHIVES